MGILNLPAISLPELSNSGIFVQARVIRLCRSCSEAGPPDACSSTTIPRSGSGGHLENATLI